MSDIVIKIEDLSKLYRVGEIGTGTISHDLNRWFAKVRGKEDPYAKVGHVNDRTQKAEKGEHVWALQDINLEVKQGEVLGIIGKNGAGKSTLLKLLSRVTSPTTGTIKTKGRLASLLEVGTGFHPEMTGRENIYMNGTIMGMRRWEISRKLDEIVDFAGVAKYLDTPVKRYSSGMTVRLGFAIAAFLEPEILVVDEVLAVGDAEFQKKAIGKMQDVSKGEGRTVLFVSHNMKSVGDLCNTTLILNYGKVVNKGDTFQMIEKYLFLSSNGKSKWLRKEKENGLVSLLACYIEQNGETDLEEFSPNFELDVNLEFEIKESMKGVISLVRLKNSQGQTLFTSWEIDDDENYQFLKEKGIHKSKMIIPSKLLRPGDYFVSVGFHNPNKEVYEFNEDILCFKISQLGYSFNINRDSIMHPNISWKNSISFNKDE